MHTGNTSCLPVCFSRCGGDKEKCAEGLKTSTPPPKAFSAPLINYSAKLAKNALGA